jgi:sorting nexin-1/2
MSFADDPILGGEVPSRSEPIPMDESSSSVVVPKTITVSNPEHHGKGRQRHTTYLVKTTYSDGSAKNVRRRYSDFTWLQKRLVEERAGNIIPAIPHKIANVKIKFDDDFVEDRRVTLQRFMTRAIHHPDLPKAPSFVPFISENATDWERTKSQSNTDISLHSEKDPEKEQASNDTIAINVDRSTTTQKPGRFANWMTKARTKIAFKLGDPKLEETPAEGKKFEDLATYADHLETCVKILTEDAAELLGADKVQGEKLKTMAAAFSELWGENKLSNASSSTMYQKLGDCWTNLSTAKESQHAAGLQKLETPLKELEEDVAALKQALTQRKEALYRYTHKVNVGNAKEIQFEKMKVKDELGDKYFELEAELKQNDTERKLLSETVETVSNRLLSDADRFRHEFHEKMRATLEMYHTAQVSLNGNVIVMNLSR